MYEDVPNGPIYAASIPHVAGQRLQLDEVSAVAIPDVMALQSPTSRGSDCNRRSSAHLRRLPGFNPLRRGAATATRRRLAPHGGDGRASIPYVAGQRLQPAGSRPGRPSPSSFNPLRRGAATATRAEDKQADRPEELQSPTSRGSDCNRTLQLESEPNRPA